MPQYTSSQNLYEILQTLFEEMRVQTPNPVDTLASNPIVIRFKIKQPEAELWINARRRPVQIHYGDSLKIRPELDILLKGDTLHRILMDELSLKKAVASGEMRVAGPVWKTFPLAEIFRQGQSIYPRILQKRND